MTRVTYTGSASVWHTHAHGGIIAENGETIDVDDDTATALIANQDFERATDDADDDAPEFDALADSVADLEDELAAGDHDDHLAVLKRDEEQHADRKTAKEAIDERRRHVATAGNDTGEEGS